MWIIGSILGSISLAILNTISKIYEMTFLNFGLIVAPFSLITTLFFWYAFQASSNGFLKVWFIQSGLVSIFAFVVNWLFIGDVLKMNTIIPILIILFGIVLLKISL